MRQLGVPLQDWLNALTDTYIRYWVQIPLQVTYRGKVAEVRFGANACFNTLSGPWPQEHIPDHTGAQCLIKQQHTFDQTGAHF